MNKRDNTSGFNYYNELEDLIILLISANQFKVRLTLYQSPIESTFQSFSLLNTLLSISSNNPSQIGFNLYFLPDLHFIFLG